MLVCAAMSNRYKIVVQGEASETDSDEEVYLTSMPPQTALVGLKVAQSSNPSSTILRVNNRCHFSFTCVAWSDLGCCQVSGEASETDSDGEEEQLGQTSTPSQQSSLVLQRDLPPLIVVQDRPDIQSVVEDRLSPTHKPHGESLKTFENPFVSLFIVGL